MRKFNLEKEIFLLYRTDAWHSYSSMRLVGAFSSRYKLNAYLNRMKKHGELTDCDLQMLSESDKTHRQEDNYLISTEKINPSYDTDNKR